MRIIKTEVTENSKRLVIELAKSLDVDFPKIRTCKDCFHYDHGDKWESVYRNHHSCWNKNKTTTRPCDPDDMSHMDYVDPHVIMNLEEAIECPHYKSGLDEYKRLYEQSKEELDKLKSDIKSLCR